MQYFSNTQLLQNTLLPYFQDSYPLILLNKQFQKLNYEKYNTHIQPHGTVITYFPKTSKIREKITYRNGKRHGVFKDYYLVGKLFARGNYKNDKRDGSYQEYNIAGFSYLYVTYDDGVIKHMYIQRKNF